MQTLNYRQNTPESINKLLAQKQVYTDAKKLQGWYLFLSIPVIMALNLLLKPLLLSEMVDEAWNFDLTNSIALLALSLTLFELLYLKPTISKLKEKAAKIQENFDCFVYGLEWNSVMCGEEVCDTDIAIYSRKFVEEKRNVNNYYDWYTPNISQLDKNQSMLACQKENLGWDIVQRKKFKGLITTLAISALVISTVAGFFLGFTIQEYILSVIIPSLPAITYAISNHFDNLDAITNKEHLKSATDSVSTSGVVTTKHVRNIQNSIYLNRKDNSLVFDWFYDYERESNQRGISYASQQLVRRICSRNS
ncbi:MULTISPECIES: S-4TM family putative pore-forming effector [Vibrio]|uniref:S-4TM family putative pore-forming effector n=1 Tax=Vibrio TaxID=662 RepID=UPI002468A910|nr:S-4TM family putative pore-forming effector [Vibrio splendidus]MDH5933958.1 S-4TM family putative pore-forming effector [Vibrio splendidus]